MAGGSPFTDDGRGAFKDVYAEKQSLWAAVPHRGEQQWYCYCGMEQLGDARASLTCAVTQTIPSLFSNTQGYHFSFPSSLDWFVTINPDVQALGGKKQLHQRAAQHCKTTSSYAAVLRNCNTFEIHLGLAFSVQKHDTLSHLLVHASLFTLHALFHINYYKSSKLPSSVIFHRKQALFRNYYQTTWEALCTQSCSFRCVSSPQG